MTRRRKKDLLSAQAPGPPAAARGPDVFREIFGTPSPPSRRHRDKQHHIRLWGHSPASEASWPTMPEHSALCARRWISRSYSGSELTLTRAIQKLPRLGIR